jgi:hypothetical protein
MNSQILLHIPLTLHLLHDTLSQVFFFFSILLFRLGNELGEVHMVCMEYLSHDGFETGSVGEEATYG